MKIVVISDTHIPERSKKLPVKLMEALKSCDMVIHAGDLADQETLDLLKSSCPNVKAVCGNMDPPELKRKLTQKEVITAGKFRIGLMHGWGPPGSLLALLKENFKPDKVDMVIFGHSHSALNEYIDGVLYFNPGSPTDKIFARFNSYGIIEITDKIKAEVVKI